MVQDCPKCGLVNPPSATHCDCGYDFRAKRMDYSRDPKVRPELGVAPSFRLGRLAVGGMACGLIGLVLLVSELGGGEPDFWGVVRSVAIMGLAAGLFGFVIWRSNR